MADKEKAKGSGAVVEGSQRDFSRGEYVKRVKQREGQGTKEDKEGGEF